MYKIRCTGGINKLKFDVSWWGSTSSGAPPKTLINNNTTMKKMYINTNVP